MSREDDSSISNLSRKLYLNLCFADNSNPAASKTAILRNGRDLNISQTVERKSKVHLTDLNSSLFATIFFESEGTHPWYYLKKDLTKLVDCTGNLVQRNQKNIIPNLFEYSYQYYHLNYSNH